MPVRAGLARWCWLVALQRCNMVSRGRLQRDNHQCSRQGKRERCRCTIVVTPCGRGSRPGGRHATRGPAQVGPWWLQVGMVSLPGWGGPWERRERLGSDGSDSAKKRYNPTHPGVHQTTGRRYGKLGVGSGLVTRQVTPHLR